ncbi:MAG: malonyl-ACP O-methyltransferase BioC [Gammaproteobacteria bacterium]|jgi:malonyl-CoA O-methyltransferase
MNDIDEGLIDKRLTRAAFDRAAPGYDEHAALQRHVVDHLAESLEVMTVAPRTLLDIGAGTGYCAQTLAKHYPRARMILADFAPAMLRAARAKAPRWRSRRSYVCAEAENLPFPDRSFDLIFSSLTFQWCNDLDRVFEQCARVLRPDGLFIFSSLGPDTLCELRESWATIDDAARVNRFIDMHDVGDALVRAGFSSPVIECDRVTVNYADVSAIMRDLRGIGAVNTLAGRRRGLSTRRDFQRMTEAYESFRENGRLPATYEVVYAHAWRPQPGTRAQDGSTVATFPFADLARR